MSARKFVFIKGEKMKLSPPKVVTYWIAVAFGVLGLLAELGILSFIPIAGFWLLFIGFVILALSLLIKGV